MTQAVQFLEATVRQCVERGCDALPSLAALATQAGVSRLTMHRAASSLAARGLIRIVPRRGMFVETESTAASDTEPIPPIERGSSSRGGADGIVERLTADLLALRFRPGEELPSYKALSRRYRGSYRTLRKALHVLVDRGVVEHSGRHFRIPLLPSGSGESILAVIATTDNMRVMGALSPRAPEFWRILERECLNRHIKIEVYGSVVARGRYPWEDRTQCTFITRDRNRPMLGYLVLTLGMKLEALNVIASLATQTDRPVSIVHENAGLPLSSVARLPRANPRLCVFETAATERCALEVGRFLLRLGHRRVALFYSPRRDSRWLKRRAGLERAFREAGIDGGGRSFTPREIRTGQDMEEHFARSQIRKMALALRRKMEEEQSPISAAFQSWFRPQGGVNLRSFMLPQIMLPVFREALHDTGITAWVGVNDETAIMAYSFLARSGVNVPGEISILGLDDSIEAIGQGLTSYNFNMPALVYNSLEHVLSPASAARKTGRRLVEIEGDMMVRRTTGPPRHG